ncbi:DUF2169 domain-containing protein [Labrys sp. ZIDIC5]|uniref:DUF2169 family type VI secretion system accessory protein n=1 Tax=Labrys sedimenti TaxID=3106036 RepID=UPI002ACA69C9|nr:DUF2169 domain-containing protein [Labrys sp. ZIDIC5]MDZ5449887.1 DUF2169 domain-containing protein [Labrys sp. ZIDIC5]
MVHITNRTAFPHLRFSNSDNAGKVFGVILVKVAFDVQEDGTCVVAPEQEPFNFTDACHGAVNETSLRHPSDLVAYKPATDIIVDAIAHAPEGKPSPRWQAGLRVRDVAGAGIEKVVTVTGPRQWLPHWKRQLREAETAEWQKHIKWFDRWALSEPELISSLPMQWEYAYGGQLAKGMDEQGKPIVEAFEYNPLGRGWIDKTWTDHTRSVPAPQIEVPNLPVTEAGSHYPPANLGPVPAHWLPRRKLGGTYDQNWLDNIRPKWPPDYDFAFNNSAPEDMRSDRFLQGPLHIELINLRKGQSQFALRLDPVTLTMAVQSGNDVDLYRPPLDTLFLEIAEEDLFDCRVSLCWRLPYRMDMTDAITIAEVDHSDSNSLRALEENLKPAPTPTDCAAHSKILEMSS